MTELSQPLQANQVGYWRVITKAGVTKSLVQARLAIEAARAHGIGLGECESVDLVGWRTGPLRRPEGGLEWLGPNGKRLLVDMATKEAKLSNDEFPRLVEHYPAISTDLVLRLLDEVARCWTR